MGKEKIARYAEVDMERSSWCNTGPVGFAEPSPFPFSIAYTYFAPAPAPVVVPSRNSNIERGYNGSNVVREVVTDISIGCLAYLAFKLLLAIPSNGLSFVMP